MKFDPNDKIDYMDGLLRSLPYHCGIIIDLGERLERINDELCGDIKSPTIKNIELAKCQEGTKVYNNNICELIAEEQETRERLQPTINAWNKIARYLQGLNDEELKIVTMYYEYGMSFEKIGELLNMSGKTVSRRMYQTFKDI